MPKLSLKKWLKSLIRPLYLKTLAWLPLRARVIFGYVVTQHAWPNINHPTTFNEKVLWRKLYDRDPRLPTMVDKIAVKEWIASTFGQDKIIPTLAVFTTLHDIDFSKAPLNAPPYVLKTNHGSATNIYVRTSADLLDPVHIKRRLRDNLAHDHGATRGEWAYTEVHRKVFVEPFVETAEGYLTDYRFHVFDGKVALIETTVDANGDTRMIFFDKSWTPVPDLTWGFPRFAGTLIRPTQLEAMTLMAETIGALFSYVRVDLYEIKGTIKFGELTFYPGAGHDRFDPPAWGVTFGKLWTLPIASA